MADKKQADLLRAMLEDCRQNFAQLFEIGRLPCNRAFRAYNFLDAVTACHPQICR